MKQPNTEMPSPPATGSATANDKLIDASKYAVEYLTAHKRKLDLDFIGYEVLDLLEKALAESPNPTRHAAALEIISVQDELARKQK